MTGDIYMGCTSADRALKVVIKQWSDQELFIGQELSKFANAIKNALKIQDHKMQKEELEEIAYYVDISSQEHNAMAKTLYCSLLNNFWDN